MIVCPVLASRQTKQKYLTQVQHLISGWAKGKLKKADAQHRCKILASASGPKDGIINIKLCTAYKSQLKFKKRARRNASETEIIEDIRKNHNPLKAKDTKLS